MVMIDAQFAYIIDLVVFIGIIVAVVWLAFSNLFSVYNFENLPNDQANR